MLLAVGRADSMGHRPAPRPPTLLVVEQADQLDYRLVNDDQGGFFALWTRQSSTPTYTLMVEHLNAQGVALWSTRGIEVGYGLADVKGWDAFSDGRGGVTVAWSQKNAIKTQRLGPDGKTLWEAELVVNRSTSPIAAPVGMADASSGAILVWPEKRFPDRWVLVAQHFNAAGVPIWNPDGQRVSLYPSDQRHPQVAADSQSGVVIGWKETRVNSSRVQAQRIDYQGNLLWGQEGILITAPAGGPEETVLLQAIGQGNSLFGWRGAFSGVSRFFLQAYSPQGHVLWDPRGLPFSTGVWEEWNPVLWGTGDGPCWTGWEDHRDHAHWQLYAGTLAPDGQLLLPETALAPTSTDQGRLVLAGDGHGGIFAAWLDNRQGGTGLYAQQVDVQGRHYLGSYGETVAPSLTKPLPPRLVGIAPGRAALLWADQKAPGQWTISWVFVTGGGQF